MSRSENEPKTIRFKAGDKVRVKYGVIDPDFPDIPLGGWTGAITEIEDASGQLELTRTGSLYRIAAFRSSTSYRESTWRLSRNGPKRGRGCHRARRGKAQARQRRGLREEPNQATSPGR